MILFSNYIIEQKEEDPDGRAVTADFKTAGKT
jgi:hypothetical protein